MVTVENRVLQIGVGHLKVVRLARCVFESKCARDAFEQSAPSLPGFVTHELCPIVEEGKAECQSFHSRNFPWFAERCWRQNRPLNSASYSSRRPKRTDPQILPARFPVSNTVARRVASSAFPRSVSAILRASCLYRWRGSEA